MPEYEVHETFRIARRVHSSFRKQFEFVDEIPERARRIGARAITNAQLTAVDLIRNREAFELTSRSDVLRDTTNHKLSERLKKRNICYMFAVRVSVGAPDIFSFADGDRVLGLPILEAKEVLTEERACLEKDIANIGKIAELPEDLGSDYVPVLGLATLRDTSGADLGGLLDFVSEQPLTDHIDLFELSVLDAKLGVATV